MGRMGEAMKEKLLVWLAYHLPKSLVYWAAIRVLATASCEEFAEREITAITGAEALKAWRERK